MHRFRLRVAVLTALAIFYIVLTQKYRAYDIDNPWFLSFTYYACHGGKLTDEFKQLHFPTGMDGVHLFGKVASHIQCLWMNQFGWTPPNITLLNTIFAIAALALFWAFLHRSGYRERWIAALVALLGVSEPFVSMAEKARFEFFAFLLMCLALYLGVLGWEFVAALVAFLAVETEPAAIVIPMVVVVLLFSRTRQSKALLGKVAVAGALAFGVYLWMHPGAVQELASATGYADGQGFGGALRAYFIDRRRHLLEALLLVVGAALFMKHRREVPNLNPLWMSILCCITLIFLHSTVAYLVFAMPFLLWTALEGYGREKGLRWVPAGLFALLLLSYVYLYKVNLHEGFRTQDFAALRGRIAEAAHARGLPVEAMRVTGDYSVWFAHPESFRALDNTAPLRNADLYLCFDGPLQPGGMSARSSLSCDQAKALAPMHELSTLDMRGHLIHILAAGSQNVNTGNR